MEFIIKLIVQIVILVLVFFIIRTITSRGEVLGEMDVRWNEEKDVWDVTLHVPNNTDYSKKKKLILKINNLF